MSALTIAELELESAELLPGRETMTYKKHGPSSFTYTVTQIDKSVTQTNDGGALNGNQVLTGNNVSVLSFGHQSSNVYGGQYQSNSNG